MVSSVVFVPVFRRQRPEPVFLVELQQGVGIFLFNLGSTDRLVPWWGGVGGGATSEERQVPLSPRKHSSTSSHLRP